MKLDNELKQLKKYIGRPGEVFDKKYQLIKQNFTAKKDIEKIDQFIRDGLRDMASDLKQFNEALTIKEQLTDISEIVSLSYIAKKYFNKKRQWIYQRINGLTVNGKPATFNKEEIKILNKAFKDIGKQIGATSVSLN